MFLSVRGNTGGVGRGDGDNGDGGGGVGSGGGRSIPWNDLLC